jgi:beta-lactamase class D
MRTLSRFGTEIHYLRPLLKWIACLSALFRGQAIGHADDAVCTLIAEARPCRLVRLIGVCDRRVTPASGFKVAISLMGYLAGFLVDATCPALPLKEECPDWNPAYGPANSPIETRG